MGKRKFSGKDDKTKPSDKQNNVEDTEEPAEKKPNIDIIKSSTNITFDIKHFRKELASKQGQTIALTQFLQVCLNPDAQQDYILEYLKAGGNSHEILHQIGPDSKKNLTLCTPAFHLFYLIVLKVQSSLPHMITITEEACRYFLNNFSSTVEIMISENSGPRHRKIILKLLTSMVTLNADLGIEVLNLAPLTPKNLQYILEKPNYKEQDNVRTAFVHFMTSFLVDGHLPLIKALLEKQGLLMLVTPGLVQDEAEAVMMFLSILKRNLVDNSLISKSLKLKTFSHNALHQMFRIYQWRGPPEAAHGVINQCRPEIHKLLTDIMLTLFTSHKLGLYFADSTLGTTDGNKNQNLNKALLTLKRPWENKGQQSVILEIIYRCPDLHRAIFTVIEQSFEPQHSPIWQRAVEFVIKVFDKLKPEEMVLKFTKLTPLQVANFVRFTTLPVPLLKSIQTSLMKSDRTVSLYCIKVLVKMLSSVKRYMQLLEMDSSHNSVDLRSKLEYFLPKHLPATAVIVALINKIIKNEKNVEMITSQDYKLPKVIDADALISLIDTLLLYNEIHPAHFDTLEETFVIKDILDYSSSLYEGNISVLKFKIVSLWLTVDSTAVSLDNPLFKDLFHIMLEVYTSRDNDSWIEAKETIFKFFKTTSIFEVDEDEIHIILYTLRNCNVETLVISDIVEYVMKNNKELTEYVRTQVANIEVCDVNNAADLENLLDDLMKGIDTDDTFFLKNQIPSPFIIGCVRFIHIHKEVKKSLKQFLTIYIANILHCNYSPELTELLIGDTKLEVRNYIAHWIREPISLIDDIVVNDFVLKNISQAIFSDSDLDLKQIFPFLEEETSDDNDVIHIPKSIITDSSELYVWSKYLIFCIIRLSQLKQLEYSHQKKIIHIFEFIMNLARKQHQIDVCRTILKSLFRNPHVLTIYSPINSNKEGASIFATQFFLEVIIKERDIIDYLDDKYNILKAFAQKNYTEIAKTLKKLKKKNRIDSDHTVKILQVVGMSMEDDLQVLNKICDLDIDCIRDDKEQGICLDILGVILLKYSKSVKINLPQESMQKVITLYTKLLTEKNVITNITNLESTLLEYFDCKPYHVKFVTEGNYKQFFYANTIKKTTSHLAASLLKYNVKFCLVFKEELDRKEILSQRELTLPLCNALLHHNKFLADNKDLLSIIFSEYKSNITKLIEKPHKAGQIYIACWKFIRKLLEDCMELQDCQKMFSKIHKFEVVEIPHIELIQTIFLKLCKHADDLSNEHLINYFLSMLNTTSTALKEAKQPNDLDKIVTNILIAVDICSTVQRIATDDKDCFKRITESSIFQNFCKVSLKDSVKLKTEEMPNGNGPKLLYLLTKLVELFYPDNHDDIVTLFDMVTSHSEFLKVMLSHSSFEVKTALIQFLFSLIKKNTSVMKTQQIPVYLSAYHATRQPCDRLILTILHFYETNGLPVHEYKPYVFGDSAANHYAVQKKKTASLWAHPTPNQVINLFDKEVIEKTVRNFSVTQKLEYVYETSPNLIMNNQTTSIRTLMDDLCSTEKILQQEKSVKESRYAKFLKETDAVLITSFSHSEEDNSIYDPAFLFPLLSHLMAPGSVASCFKLLRCGLLAVPVVALSSHCPNMRAAAYHVLHRFCMLLETETRHKNDKVLLNDFVEVLRNSIATVTANEAELMKNPRLPAVGALYLAKALMVSTASFHPLYKPVNNFLIAKHKVNLSVVPDFLSLFHDSDVESVERRNWILEIIRDGTKTMTDVTVVFKTMCVKMIMDFYSSVLCDRKCKERILGVIGSLVAIPRGFEILIEGYGLLSWLHGVVRHFEKEDRLLFKNILVIIKNIHYSLCVNVYSNNLGNLKNKSVLDMTELKIDKHLQHDVLLLMYGLTNLIEYVGETEIVLLLKVYNLISKKALKLFSKKEILRLLKECMKNVKDCEKLSLLCRAVLTNDNSILNSKTILSLDSNDVNKDLIEESIRLVTKYVL